MARQHAQRDIVLPILSVRLSVCLSVCPMPVLCQNEWTHRQTFFTFRQRHHLVFYSSTTTLSGEKHISTGSTPPTTTKFCMASKPDVRQILHRRPRMLTRDPSAVANLSVCKRYSPENNNLCAGGRQNMPPPLSSLCGRQAPSAAEHTAT